MHFCLADANITSFYNYTQGFNNFFKAFFESPNYQVLTYPIFFLDSFLLKINIFIIQTSKTSLDYKVYLQLVAI